MNRHVFASALILALGAAVSPQDAGAVNVIRYSISHGAANCQAALPVFDGNIRKRPMGISNEGSGSAFLTCDSESTDYNAAGAISEVGVYVTNRSAGAVALNCTLVDGLVPYRPQVAFTKTSSSISSNSAGGLSWIPSDNGGANFSVPALSCNLPPGVEVNAIQFVRTEDVGN